MTEARDKSSGKRSLGGTLLLAVLVLAVWLARSQGWLPEPETSTSAAVPSEQVSGSSPGVDAGAEEIARAARTERSGFMVTTLARVKKTLSDDNDGSRHQRFIVRLGNDLTVLVAHNIDLAPRVPLEEGETVEIRGQYEWNEQGGVLHWTHRDPQQRREGGWIRHAGVLYE